MADDGDDLPAQGLVGPVQGGEDGLGGIAAALRFPAHDPAHFRDVLDARAHVALEVRESDLAEIGTVLAPLGDPIAVAEQGPEARRAENLAPGFLAALRKAPPRKRTTSGSVIEAALGVEIARAEAAQAKAGRFEDGGDTRHPGGSRDLSSRSHGRVSPRSRPSPG